MKIDMSPKAIERRLKELNEIWLLCVTLSKARPTHVNANRRSDLNKTKYAKPLETARQKSVNK